MVKLVLLFWRLRLTTTDLNTTVGPTHRANRKGADYVPAPFRLSGWLSTNKCWHAPGVGVDAANLTAEENANGSITLSWEAPDDESVTGYRILRRRPDQGETELLAHVSDTGTADTAYTTRRCSRAPVTFTGSRQSTPQASAITRTASP